MKLNCEPGDVAVILRPAMGGSCSLTDRLVTVVELAAYDSNGTYVFKSGKRTQNDYNCHLPTWVVRFSSPVQISDMNDNPIFTDEILMWDHRLRPIRDPGEDATDETLNWLPVPVKETV